MADNYQISRYTNTGMALINWTDLPILMASTVASALNSSLPSTLQVLPGCDLVQLQMLISQWRTLNSKTLVLASGGSARAFSQVAPTWPVQIRITRSGNTLVVNSWDDALKLADWDYLDSENTQVIVQ